MKDSYNFNLVTFNRELRNQLKQVTKEKDVNNMELFVMNDDAKVSVTLEANCEMQNQYHGLCPKFDDIKLKEFLFRKNDVYKSIVNNPENFWRKIKEDQNKNNYMDLLINNEYSEIEEINQNIESIHCLKTDDMMVTLLGRAILQMATHFGFSIKVPVFSLNKFLYILRESFSGILDFSKEFKKGEFKKNLFWQFDDDFSVIHTKGIWPLSAIEKLTKWYDYQGNTLIYRSSSSDSSNELYQLLTFHDTYENKYQNSFDYVYYSGVMPKVLHIRYEDMPTAANNMKFIVFEVARTTFATIDMLDNPETISHPFFRVEISKQSYKDLMVKFDEHEDTIQEKYLYGPEYAEGKDAIQIPEVDNNSNKRIGLTPTTVIQRHYEQWMIDNLNKYLARSFNTNTIAVSANIVTKDDYLLIGKRGKLTIDNDQYYCSVNGQSEFRDSNVSFYRNSVFEDLPSMEYDSKYRIDLNNEIQRESLAELGLPFFEREWSYYGISYLSINNTAVLEKKESVMKRRMHFNVLTHNSTSYTFSDVNKSQKKATESFENERLRGIKVKVHPDFVSRLLSFGRAVIEYFIKYKSNIFILYFIISLFSARDGILNFRETNEVLSFTEKIQIILDNIRNVGIKNIIDIIIFLFFVYTSAIEIFKYRPVKKLLVTKNYMIKFHRDKYSEEENTGYNIRWRRIYEIITEKNLFYGIARKSVRWLKWEYGKSTFKIFTDQVRKIIFELLSNYHTYPLKKNPLIVKIRKGVIKAVRSIIKYLTRNEISRVHGIVYIMYSMHFHEKVKAMKKPYSWLKIKKNHLKYMKEVLLFLLRYTILVMVFTYILLR